MQTELINYTYKGETIEAFNAFPIWLIKGNEYQMVNQTPEQELAQVADFRDENGDIRQVPLDVME